MDCVFITNDDGYNEGMESLINYLHNLQIPLLVIIPKINKSASSMSISLRKQMRISRKFEIEKKLKNNNSELKIYTLDGTPTDCSLFLDFAKDSDFFGGMNPIFAISGVNHGANLSHDILHSGTFGAARQTSMNGLPSIASSYCDYSGNGIRKASKITAEICNLLWNKESTSNKLLQSFFDGSILLNLNVPSDFNGELKLASLGIRDYKNALSLNSIDGYSEVDIKFQGPNIVEEEIQNTDVTLVGNRVASISLIPTWPFSHPRYPNEVIINAIKKLDSIEEFFNPLFIQDNGE